MEALNLTTALGSISRGPSASVSESGRVRIPGLKLLGAVHLVDRFESVGGLAPADASPVLTRSFVAPAVAVEVSMAVVVSAGAAAGSEFLVIDVTNSGEAPVAFGVAMTPSAGTASARPLVDGNYVQALGQTWAFSSSCASLVSSGATLDEALEALGKATEETALDPAPCVGFGWSVAHRQRLSIYFPVDESARRALDDRVALALPTGADALSGWKRLAERYSSIFAPDAGLGALSKSVALRLAMHSGGETSLGKLAPIAGALSRLGDTRAATEALRRGTDMALSELQRRRPDSTSLGWYLWAAAHARVDSGWFPEELLFGVIDVVRPRLMRRHDQRAWAVTATYASRIAHQLGLARAASDLAQESASLIEVSGVSPGFDWMVERRLLSGQSSMALNEITDLARRAGSGLSFDDAAQPLAAIGTLASLGVGLSSLLAMPSSVGIDLAPCMPEEWLGETLDVRKLGVDGAEVSYSIRWSGQVPTLLWELSASDLRTITISSLAPGFATSRASGEVELPAVGFAPKTGLTSRVALSSKPKRR